MTTQIENGSIAEPWELQGDTIWGISPWNARVRLTTATPHNPMNGIDSKAIARLMIAAPKLRAALHYLLEQTVDMDLKHGIALSEGEEDARTVALSAIAEATEQQPMLVANESVA